MMMCSDCLAKQNAAITTIETAVKIDQSVQIKTDLFNAATVAAVELRGAVQADASISDDDKNFRYAEMCLERFNHMQSVIFQTRTEATELMERLNKQENEARMWQTQVQTTAATLRQELRDKFKAMDVTYSPVSVKTPKPKAVKAPSKNTASQRQAIHDAAKKYNVSAPLLSMMLLNHKSMSPDEAAKKMLADKAALLSNSATQ